MTSLPPAQPAQPCLPTMLMRLSVARAAQAQLAATPAPPCPEFSTLTWPVYHLTSMCALKLSTDPLSVAPLGPNVEPFLPHGPVCLPALIPITKHTLTYYHRYVILCIGTKYSISVQV